MDSERGKLFIGGISWETTEETLKEHFQSYGEVVETVIMRDRLTGRARGFGFIGFADPAVVDRLLQEKHIINGRTVELKRAMPRDEQQRNAQKSIGKVVVGGGPRTKKIFVGGLAPTVTENDFRKYFEQFGNITDVVVMYDHQTQRPRGFGFITFDSEEAVDKVVLKSFHELHEKMVEVKRALPKEMSPGSARARSSPASRYGAPPAGTGGYSPYGPGSGYFSGGYGPGMNGGPYGAAPAAAPGYGGTPAGGYAGGSYGGAYGNPVYGPGPGPYVSAPVAGGYSAGPWGPAVPTGPAPGVNAAGYGYGCMDAGYTGGYGVTGTGSYVSPAAGGGNSYPVNTGDVYGSSGYADPYGAPPSGGGGGGNTPSSGYVSAPMQTDTRVNGSSGYGATGRQTQRIGDARFRPYPASSERAS